MKKKRFLSILLSLSLMLVLIPGMSLTVYADNTPVTNVTLNPSTAQTIDVGGKVSFTATIEPTNASDKEVKWNVGGSNTNAVTLYSDEDCKNKVQLGADTSILTVYAKGKSTGTATVTVTSNKDTNKKASCEVRVVKPAPKVNITTQPKDLNLTYGYTDKPALTVSAEEIDGYDLTYQWFTCKDKNPDYPDPIEGATSASYTIPMGLNAGATYYFCCINAVSREGGMARTGVAESDVATVTVNKAAPTVTAPTAKTLIYNGSAQELVNAGSTKDGTIQYAIGTKDVATESYKTDIPKGTEVGTYYVWYKVVGDANHTDSVAKCVTVTISKKEESSSTTTETTTTTPITTPAPKTAAPTSQQEKITISKAPKIKKLRVKKNKVQVTWNKIRKNKAGKKLIKQIRYIEIQAARDPEFQNIVATKNVGKKKSKTVLKLGRKTTYFVRVRYVGADGVSKWSKVKKVKTK